MYNQIWDKIKEFINSVDDVNFEFSDYSRDHSFIRLDTDYVITCYGKCLLYDNRYLVCL